MNRGSGIGEKLASFQTERDMAEWLAAELTSTFPHTSWVDIFLGGSSSAANLVAVRDPRGGPALLSALCSGIEAMPDHELRSGSLARWMPYLMVPNLVWANPQLGRGPMMSAPLLTGNTVNGIIVVEAGTGAPEFALDDLNSLTTAAGAASAAVSALHGKHRPDTERWRERDLALAREIQRTFLPPLLDDFQGLQVAAEYHPAFEVGGDFYDLMDIGDGRVTAIIGDVSGKGVAAALLMSRVSSELRQYASGTLGPKGILESVNRWLESRAPSDKFATVACVRLDLRRRLGTVCNAGHVSPILRRTNGLVVRLADASGPPLGMLPSQSYDDVTFHMGPGDILLLVTDGIVEALDADADAGMWSLVELIARSPHNLTAIRQNVLTAVEKASIRLRDDATMLGLQLPPEAARRAA